MEKEKIKLAVVFGGMSTEHDVSVVSGMSIIKNLDKEKYEIFPIYIDNEGNWYKYTKSTNEIEIPTVGYKVDEVDYMKKLDNYMEYLKEMDCVFPVLHGLYGEDGTIQGLFELLKVPYVGCKVLSSSVSMDKAYTKILFDRAGLNQAKYVYIRKNKDNYKFIEKNFDEVEDSLEEIIKKIEKKLKYPMFVKPSNSGSSVGINKVKDIEELKNAIEYAAMYDKKILIEEGIDGKEVECSVMGNEDVVAACVGEVVPAEEFYNYNSKYNSSDSKITIPAKLSKEITEKVREAAIKAYKAVDGSGLSRIDFFIEKDTNRVIVSEINTLPGFTTISMYPKLFEAAGVGYSELLDKIIEFAME